MVSWIKRSVSRQAGVTVAGCVAIATAVIWWAGRLALIPELPARRFLLVAFIVVPASGVIATFIVQRLLGSRLSHLVTVIDGTGPNNDLTRIRDLGSDEVGAIGNAVNRLLARLTSIRASMIDQERELDKAQRELELRADLAAKTQELAHRFEERSMLFDIMRMTTSSPELDGVLHGLVERVGQLLRMREVVFLTHHHGPDELVVKAAHGFPVEARIEGRSMLVGEGITTSVVSQREVLHVPDVSKLDNYQAFWGLAEKSGALAAVPVTYQGHLLGLLAVTRAPNDPITETHLRLLAAIADTAAMAIQNAQLFEHMRAMTTQDELTGLPNDVLLRTQLEREIDRARRFDTPFSVVSLGVDHLSAFNNEHGREEGDKALHAVSQLIANSVRKVDTVARSEEDRLVLLLPRTDAKDAVFLCEKLRKAVLGLALPVSVTGQLGVSLGVAQLNSTDDRLGRQLLARSEQALLAAKNTGRNRVVVAGDGRISAPPPPPPQA